MLRKQFNSTEDYISYLENLSVQLLTEDYLSNTLADRTISRFLTTFKTLLDAEEFVPKGYLRRTRDKIFKDFCKRWKLDKKAIKRHIRLCNKIERLKNNL